MNTEKEISDEEIRYESEIGQYFNKEKEKEIIHKIYCPKGNHIGYEIPARTIKFYGSTLAFYKGCNRCRARLLKAIVKSQKQRHPRPVYSPTHYPSGVTNYIEKIKVENSNKLKEKKC